LTALSTTTVIRDLAARDLGPRTRSRELAAEALAIEAEEARRAGALGFMARVLVQTTLPHSRPAANTFLRRNGRLILSISAHPLLGLPYGRYPRLLMAWVTTEAVRTKSATLHLGDTLSGFMARLGLLRATPLTLVGCKESAVTVGLSLHEPSAGFSHPTGPPGVSQTGGRRRTGAAAP
jgi:hypothetical protein